LPGAAGRETRKTVTAVFADLVGSTPLQERIDVESAHHVMDRFYATMRQALQAHGGHVAELRGDAVVGLFGFPTVREDDALRAVRAAAAMRDALGALNDELHRDWGVRIGMRVGLNTGEVVISPEGLAVGDAMNTAARLEQAAPPGQVLVGESTWRQVRHAVLAEPIEPLALKGKRAPVAAFRLLDAPAAAQARVRIEAPLIGRDAELRRLLAGFEHTMTTGACGLVSVIGSPGLGKTRLAQELDTRLGERARVVWGRCEPIGEGTTFAPVVQVLRGAAGIGEADPEPEVRAKLAALVPDDPDAELLVARAAGILGFGAAAPAAETFWAVRRFLGALAGSRPLLVVLDDVHWGQPTFWELIEHLAEWGRHAPILLLALARPELRELRAALAKPGGLAHDVLELAPLGTAHSRLLVDELLDRAEVPETWPRGF
jgi:class 3 adenylate cyclase